MAASSFPKWSHFPADRRALDVAQHPVARDLVREATRAQVVKQCIESSGVERAPTKRWFTCTHGVRSHPAKHSACPSSVNSPSSGRLPA